jgi:hypothetical protein
MLEGDYIRLSTCPEVPPNKVPSKAECGHYEYITMVQLCNIAENNKIGRSKVYNAFGGNKGKIKVISERKAREFGGRKFVLVSAVIDYFQELGIAW